MGAGLGFRGGFLYHLPWAVGVGLVAERHGQGSESWDFNPGASVTKTKGGHSRCPPGQSSEGGF